ncbi:hypothetical protein C4S75_05585 [Apibacter sp. wkB309]|nr:hypothetical protein C4S75_05585 [Apibacter sp. wkB309]
MNRLRDLRKKTFARKITSERLKKEREFNDFLKRKNDKWYIEKKYMSYKLFKYLLFLRKEGADINRFFDSFL